MNFSRVLATIALGALAVAVVTASFFLTRSPEPSLASDAVSVDVSQTPEAATAPAQSLQVQTPAAAPVPQVPAGAPVQRAVPPNLGSDDDWCDVNAAHRDDDCDDDWDDTDRDDNDDWDDQNDDWDDDIDDGQDD
ncbi:hypothetical protein [Gordonia sp. WA4-43]|uniref:hypothetical protein n=1 Tax=Gordonia sp. WA4-43 TaxID=2878678 RepID=UPI001CFAA869|nr:hypothetical protein [Gordonia sp. WA4-43]UCZ88083.1 hypothetical protein LEL84_13230 [Gordonia sp. WA4-43]